MDTVLIATTRQEGLHAIGTGGQPVVQAYDQIVRDLRQNLTEEHARLFAEPNYNPSRGMVDWYAPADGPVVRYAEADPELRQKAGETLARLQAEIRERAAELGRSVNGGDRMLGQMLEMALEIPGEDFIHCVGERPVLVAWGNLVDQAQPQRGVLRKFVPYRGPLVSPPYAAAAAATPPAGVMPGGPVPAYAGVGATAVVAAEQPLYWLMWLLWLLFGLLVAAIFVLLLSGCGITWPWSAWLRQHGIVDYCVAPVAEALPPPLVEAERSRQRVLQDTLTRLQLRLAVERRRCDTAGAAPAPTAPVPAAPATPAPATPAPPPAATPPADTTPATPTSPQSQDQTPFDERLRREGGGTGEVTITLAWNSDADLDLHVLCPGGERLYYAQRQACGGRLDVDMNVGGRMSREPVENIVWQQGSAPPGRYVVIVNNFNSRSDGDQATPFHVRVIRPGETRVFDGAIRHQDGNVRVYEFTLP